MYSRDKKSWVNFIVNSNFALFGPHSNCANFHQVEKILTLALLTLQFGGANFPNFQIYLVHNLI